ncbi:MAG: basic amino acid ABC transporter substrate-binding protein [Actinomycetota bacterium]
MKNKLLVILVVIIVMASAVLVSCSKPAAVSTSALKTLKPGILTVGSDATYPPMEFKEGDTIVGFDLDITKAIAEKMGLKLEYINTAWDGMFPAVAAHKFDMVISSITITDDRKKEMDFSDPYYNANQSVIIKAGSGIDSADKLNGKKIGVQIGTTSENEAKKITGSAVSTYDDNVMAFEDLKAGRVDAIMCDSPVGDYYTVKNAGYAIGFKINTNEFYGIGFAKDTPELVKAVNSALAAIKTDGTYDKIFKTWFGEQK